MDNKELGQFGEDIAVNYLLSKGYKILSRNYEKVWNSRFKGEIDIITKKDKTISFVEVKTSLNRDNFFPEDRVNFGKQKKLIRLAYTWLEENNVPLESFWQIDVVGVVVDEGTKNTKISHFENVVSENL